MRLFRPGNSITAGGDSTAGFSLPDLLAAIVLLAIVTGAITWSSLTSSRVFSLTLQRRLALHLAGSKLEELAMVNPRTLDSGTDATELGVQAEGHEFVRQVAVTVNADGSRTVNITVHPLSSSSKVNVALQQTFFLWGRE